MIAPIPVPKTGIVQKLKLNIAPGQAEVYIHQTPWPKQRQNPNWRIEVNDIDARHDPATQKQIRDACEQVARYYLSKWLARVAPLLTLETVTWPELVKFATERRYSVPSPYQQRRMRRGGTCKQPIHLDLYSDFDPEADADDVEELELADE